MANSLSFSISISANPSRINPKPYLNLPKCRLISAIHSETKPPSLGITLPSGENSPVRPIPVVAQPSTAEAEFREKQLQSTRRTKLVCTIGPVTCGFDELEALAAGGMNVARLNMCHGTHAWHRSVIQRVKKLNEKGYAIAIMMDTQGSEIHMGDLGGASSVKAEDGDIWTFTVRSFNTSPPERTVSVNYDGFGEDVQVGDEIVVDGGMAIFEVVDKVGPDVICHCIDPGLLLPGANLTLWREGRLVQERNWMLPTISSKDWLDIDFGIKEGVDFIAVSFVKSAEVINHLKSYITARSHENDTAVISKIESIDSLKNLEEIIRASDGVMVARGDLGAQIPLEQVPSEQERIVKLCRELNRPVIVASQLLESMVEFPIPTRAEAADVSEAVRQRADALMLSGESAMGQFPQKALSVLGSISLRIEKWLREENRHELIGLSDVSSLLPGNIQEELCSAAAKLANNLEADGVFVYTRKGQMASMLSRARPDCPVFAFTPSTSVQRRLNLHWGLIPFTFDLSENAENNLNKTFTLLKGKGMIKPGDTIITISDTSQSIQVVIVP